METEQKPDPIETLDQQQPLISAYFPKLVDICYDEKGDIAFLIKEWDSLQVFTEYSTDRKIYIPPEGEHLPFKLPRAREVLRWYRQDNDQQLFEDVIAYLKRFSYLPDNQWYLATSSIFLTYIQDHPDIHYLPILLFWASPERGKSRTGKAITYVAYRGIHLVDIRSANLFRYSDHLRATLFFDVMDFWKKVERNGAVDIFLLRCEKGAKVPRVLYPGKGPFKDTVHYNVFGPTIIATNEPVHHILDVRCIPISTLNKPGDYENPIPEEAQELKERLTAWRARTMSRPLPRVEPIQGLDGRLWDITKPILQVCKLLHPDTLETVKGALLEKARQKVEDKRETIEGDIVTAIYGLSPEEIPEWSIPMEEILNEVNKKRSKGHKLTSQFLGKKVKALGLKTRKIHGYSEVVLNRKGLHTFLIQFGFLDPTLSPETLPNSTTPNNQIVSDGCPGRESTDSQEDPNDTPPTKVMENQRVERVVESGRESCGDEAPLPPSHAGSAIPNENVDPSGIDGDSSIPHEGIDRKEPEPTKKEAKPASPLGTSSGSSMTDNHPTNREGRPPGKDKEGSPCHPVSTDSVSRPNGPLHIKYRPQTWEEIRGNEEVVEALKSLFSSRPVEERPHVFLLKGPSGCGKTTIARIIKKELGCSDLYFFEINAADARGIDSIRQMISDCRFLPWIGSTKVYVLDEVHQMTKEAQNALLKILEDTPQHVYFILCTTEPKKIISTIKTRCSTYQVSPLPASLIRDLLVWVCNEERKEVPNEVLNAISQTCEGSPRQALVSLDQVIDIDDLIKALKIITRASFQEEGKATHQNSRLTPKRRSGRLLPLEKEMERFSKIKE